MTERLRATLRDPERRLDSAWTFIGVCVSGLCLWLGVGYAVGGNGLKAVEGWRVLLRFEGGNLRVHGVIMFALGFALAVQLRADYTRTTAWVLRLLRTYCFIVAACWVTSWAEYGVTWGAPAWWLLLAALTAYLTRYAPVPTTAYEPDDEVDGV